MKKCISISLNRSGSTFFVTTLNTIPKFVGDFEIQVVEDAPTPFHRSLYHYSCDEIFNEIRSKSESVDLCVSKIVLAPQHRLSFDDTINLLTTALAGVDYVVVILRPWYQQFYSKYLGGGHLSRKKNQLPSNMSNFYSDDPEFFEKRLSFEKRSLDVKECVADLQKREEIQAKLLAPIAQLSNSTVVEYKDLGQYMCKLASENSKLSARKLEKLISNSPTMKISSPSDTDLFTNIAEVEAVKDAWGQRYSDSVASIKAKANNVFDLVEREIPHFA